MSQFAPISNFPPKGLERSSTHSAESLLALALADLSSLYGARGDVSCNKDESTGVSPLSMSWDPMKAGSD